MKIVLFFLAALCVVICSVDAEPQFGPPRRGNPHQIPRNPGFKIGHRFRREASADPQFGPPRGRNPHHIPPIPEIKIDHRFRREAYPEPQFGPPQRGNPHQIPRNPGFKLGHRFRRDASPDPQGSVVFQGTQPLGGPDRQPTLDLNYQQRIIDNDRTKLDAFGGANLHGGRVSPQAGFGVEHNFNKDMFVRGHGQVEQGPRGRLSPSFGADFGWRFRRDAPEEPQGSVVLQGTQPLSGPDRQPTLDLNYQQRIIDNDRTKLDAFGGANLHRGRVSPQVGFGVEHNFNKDMFVRGHGQVEQGPRGHLSPSFGADFGWRFRRDAPEEPQGSVVFQGTQPLGGPDRQPTLDLNYQQRIIDNDRTKLDAFGGANLHNGRVSPQAGFGVEHNFNKDMFVRGHGQVEQGPRGHLSPSFGADFGWRFRREAQPYEDEEVLDEVY